MGAIMSLIKVADHPGLVRDSATGAILNTDQSKVQKALANRQKIKAQRQQVNDLDLRVANLETNVNNINAKLDTLIELLKSR